jgi:hypothetical protein
MRHADGEPSLLQPRKAGQTSAALNLIGLPPTASIVSAGVRVFVTGPDGAEFATFRDFTYNGSAFAPSN